MLGLVSSDKAWSVRLAFAFKLGVMEAPFAQLKS